MKKMLMGIVSKCFLVRSERMALIMMLIILISC